MPAFRISPDLQMHYLVNDYTDPWRKPETILLLHGNAESSAVWYAWVPHLARRYRVVRPDMRGFGASTPVPRDFPWKLDIIIDDYIRLMDTLGIARFHLACAKIGGTIGRAFAARHPERVLTLTLIGAPVAFRVQTNAQKAARTETLEKHGVAHLANGRMASRLGSAFPPEGVEWWSNLMGRTPVSTEIGFLENIMFSDVRADVSRIMCPTLVITTEHNTDVPVEKTRAWQQTIPNSTLLVLPGDSHHMAATHAERCAQATLEFISRSSIPRES